MNSTDAGEVRVTVCFDEVRTVLHFRARRSAAESFRAAAHRQRLARVNIDNAVSASLAPWPCTPLCI